jgi:hypothetical protein
MSDEYQQGEGPRGFISELPGPRIGFPRRRLYNCNGTKYDIGDSRAHVPLFVRLPGEINFSFGKAHLIKISLLLAFTYLEKLQETWRRPK